MPKKELSDKQERFCQEYIVECNAKKAAILAGYSAKTAESQASQLLKNPKVKKRLSELQGGIKKERIATAEEIMQYLTKVMNGESESNEIVIEGQAPGVSQAREMKKKPSEKDRLKAAELLYKHHLLEKNDIEEDEKPTIVIDI